MSAVVAVRPRIIETRQGIFMGISNYLITGLVQSPLARGVYGKFRALPVLGSLCHWSIERVIPRGRRVWAQVHEPAKPRIWLWIDPRFEQHLIDGAYEAAGQKLLNEFLKPGDCFYDLGAHIGVFSMLAARIVGKKGMVYSFEPNSANIRVLAENAARNGFSGIRTVEAAAWSHTDLLRFERSNPDSSGMEGRICTTVTAVEETVAVQGVAIDDFVYKNSNRPPDFIKMDIEGAEFEALKGSTRLLRERRPLILCEVHTAENACFVEDFLPSLGYGLQWLSQPSSPYPRQVFASSV